MYFHTYFPYTKSFRGGFGVKEISLGEVFLQEPRVFPLSASFHQRAHAFKATDFSNHMARNETKALLMATEIQNH
jgi:hypothetical protein